MTRKYKPATFQPTIRPDWGGVLAYIPLEEKAEILEAIIKYPSVECNSHFWLDTIKPDLDLQYNTFVEQCKAKSRGIRNRWGKTSITPLIDENNTSNTDVLVSEREREGEEESKGKGINEILKRIVLKPNQFIIDDKFRITDIPEIEIYEKEVGCDLVRKVQDWLIDKKYNQVVDKQFICKQILNFSKRQGLI